MMWGIKKESVLLQSVKSQRRQRKRRKEEEEEEEDSSARYYEKDEEFKLTEALPQLMCIWKSWLRLWPGWFQRVENSSAQ